MPKSSTPSVPWTADERRILATLTSPRRIQDFLDATDYSTESRYRAPRSVMRDRKAHCFDGAIFAAAALQRIGHRPLIIDMQAVRDDDHVIALYSVNGHLGAVAKSNMTGIRFRDPVFKTARELVMSYFDQFFNINGERTLRCFSGPTDLRKFDKHGWHINDDAMDVIGDWLNEAPVTELLTPAQKRALTRVDKKLFDAGFLGANWDGLYKP